MIPNIDIFYSFNGKDYIEVKEHNKKVKELEKEIERLKNQQDYYADIIFNALGYILNFESYIPENSIEQLICILKGEADENS